jgi:hypothetical protein
LSSRGVILGRVLLVAAAVAIAAAPGCNIVAPAAYLIGGLPKKKADYILPDVPTVVFVDDRANVIGTNSRGVRLAIADALSSRLLTEKLVTEVISSRDAIGMTIRNDRHQNLMAIDEIARSVGAEQIIFIQMANFGVAQDGAAPAPMAAGQLRVIDAVNRQKLFPAPDAESTTVSWPVTAWLRQIDPQAMADTTTRVRVYEALANEFGEEAARLFYDYVPDDIGSRLDPQ